MRTQALIQLSLFFCMGGLAAVPALGELTLEEPCEYQVFQRTSRDKGLVRIAGELTENTHEATTIEARTVCNGSHSQWRSVKCQWQQSRFVGQFEATAGGWFAVEVRAANAGEWVAHAEVAHVAVGEIFVVAGQSNSANHGEVRQRTSTGRVAAFDGRSWQIAHDPQPGASGDAGSFMPPLGDLLVEVLDVPIGFVACGLGGTSVREWLPSDVVFPSAPTVRSHVVPLPTGDWTSDGQAYARFVGRMRPLGPHGFRAVLWHQGESDANQADPACTLDGELYAEYLRCLINESRGELEWSVPWFVAQATYHVPGDEGSADIRGAQASLWADGTALQGPDTDTLKGHYREQGGRGVHLSDAGLQEHAKLWSACLLPWLQQQLMSSP